MKQLNTIDSGEFFTEAQLEYAQSIAVREVLRPTLAQLERSFKQLERSTRHSLFSIKVRTRGFNLPIKYYAEKDLETTVECGTCGLVFAIYGVFAVCPDCSRPITMSMFKKSLEVARKRLSVLERIPSQESELREALLTDTLSGTVATFDSLGKRLREEFPAIFPKRPRNLFQNLDALCHALEENASIISKILSEKATTREFTICFKFVTYGFTISARRMRVSSRRQAAIPLCLEPRSYLQKTKSVNFLD